MSASIGVCHDGPMHGFVDESERGCYTLGVVLAPPGSLSSLRRLLRGMLAPKERRLHFNTERPARRRKLLSDFAAMPPTRTWLYQAKGPTPEARHACMETMLDDLCTVKTRRLVLEAQEPRQEQRDRATIYQAVRNGLAPTDLVYDHVRPWEDPMLWLIDGILWAHGAGSDWRRRVGPLVERVTEI